VRVRVQYDGKFIRIFELVVQMTWPCHWCSTTFQTNYVSLRKWRENESECEDEEGLPLQRGSHVRFLECRCGWIHICLNAEERHRKYYAGRASSTK